MSKSLRRVKAHLDAAKLDVVILELTQGTKTAQAAADAANCDVDQIAKSIIFQVENTDELVLFVTAGGQHVDTEKAAKLFGATLTKADAKLVRKITGFAIGGVSPIGHLSPIACFFDKTLLRYENVWAAAGTPHHIFELAPSDLCDLAGGTFAQFTQ